MMPDDEPPAQGAAADAAVGRRLARWRRLVIWQGAWEAGARASVRLGLAHRPCLRTREDCQEVAHMRQAVAGVALFARLLRQLAENA